VDPWRCRTVADCVAAKGILKHGMKKKLQQHDPAQTATMERLDEIFETGRAHVTHGCLGRRLPRTARLVVPAGDRRHFAVASSFRRTLPPRMVRARSWICPKVVVGTIHSVKGGQADVVYLFPDLSQARGRSIQPGRRGRAIP